MEIVKKLFLILFLGIIIGGCSNEETGEYLINQNIIKFNVLTTTRATLINSSNLTNIEFVVWALTKDSTFFMGEPVENSSADNLGGIRIKYDNLMWNYADTNDIHYWPTESLDFYAIGPTPSTMTYSWNITRDKKEISYITLDEYGDYSGTGLTNVDAMYAIKKDQTSNSGKVQLNFNHILSNIVFKATTENANLKVYIESIKLCNIITSGVFTIPNSKPKNSDWKLNSLLNSSLTLIKDTNICVTNDTILPITIESPTMIIPQTLTKWDVTNQETKTIAQANIAKQSYLEVSCKIKQNGVYLYGSDTEFSKLYIPFGVKFEPNNRYIYTIHFGGGYDENGNKIMNFIQFNPTVEEWNEISYDL